MVATVALATLLVGAAGQAAASKLVRVNTPTDGHKQRLQALDLDLTEHGGRGFIGVVLHGAADERLLRREGFTFGVIEEDLEEQAERDAKADLRYAQTTQASPLPSGREGYRTYEEYLSDMDALVRDHPGLVRKIVIGKSFEGRDIVGVEITNNVNASDGKPVYLQMGLHHAREWPSGEHAIEWAFELAKNYGRNARTTDLVNRVRTIVVPVVNPDGFILSRMSRPDDQGDPGTGDQRVDENAELARVSGDPAFEFKRKNCRVFGGDAPCESNRRFGVDLNRNYGAFFGGPGASDSELDEDYHGEGPFSEPETEAVRRLISARHVTTLITNHTFSNLVLRPPGVAARGVQPDETELRRLADAMAEQNGYASIPGYGLYDTSGTTEDWSYSITGGYGYTFEIGPNRFHPLFQATVNEWTGEAARARPGASGREGGNRAAYYLAMENAANSAHHSVVTGSGSPGNVVRLRKVSQTPTNFEEGETGPASFEDRLETSFRIPASGQFEWHANPSTRPLVAGRPGRTPQGPVSPVQNFAMDEVSIPCATPDTTAEECKEDNEFTVPGQPNDNGFAEINIEWPEEASDWDLAVYRKNPSGSLTKVGSSAQGGTTEEHFTIVDPTPDGTPVTYVARVTNFAAATPWTGKVTFKPPNPPKAGQTEAWTLSCERPDGTVLGSRELTIGRNQVAGLGLDCGAGQVQGPPTLDTVAPTARISAPRLSSERARNSTIVLGLSGTDAGTGLASLLVEARELGRATATPYRVIAPAARPGSLRFKARRGRTYQFRVRAIDFAGNASRGVGATTIVPVNDGGRGSRFRGFRRIVDRNSYYGAVRRSSRRGARATFVFRGGNLYIVGTKSPSGGKARVTVDGRRRVIDTYSRRTQRRALLLRVRLRGNQRHRAVIQVLGQRRRGARGSIVALDAFGVYRGG